MPAILANGVQEGDVKPLLDQALPHVNKALSECLQRQDAHRQGAPARHDPAAATTSTASRRLPGDAGLGQERAALPQGGWKACV